jgi:hypothetical protein
VVGTGKRTSSRRYNRERQKAPVGILEDLDTHLMSVIALSSSQFHNLVSKKMKLFGNERAKSLRTAALDGLSPWTQKVSLSLPHMLLFLF